MAHDVFISHANRDKAVADAVCAALEGRGLRCWYAPRDVPPGEPWAEALMAAIGDARTFVLILSNGSKASPQVMREVQEAADREVPILPLRVEDVQPSAEMGFYIKRIHWLDALTPPLEKHLQTLADRVAALLAVEAPPAAPASPLRAPVEPRAMPARLPATAGRRVPRRAWIIAGALLLLSLAGGVGWWLGRGGGPGGQTPVVEPSPTAAPAPSTRGQLSVPSPPPSGTAAPAAVEAHVLPRAEPVAVAYDGAALWALYHDNLLRLEPVAGEPRFREAERGALRADYLAGAGTPGQFWALSGSPADGNLRLTHAESSGTQLAEYTFPAAFEGWPYALAWDGEFVWVVGGATLYKLRPPEGGGELILVDSYAQGKLESRVPGGLAWDGESLWLIVDDQVYRLDGLGQPVCAVALEPYWIESHMYKGLAWDGRLLWAADYRTGKLYRIDPAACGTPGTPGAATDTPPPAAHQTPTRATATAKPARSRKGARLAVMAASSSTYRVRGLAAMGKLLLWAPEPPDLATLVAADPHHTVCTCVRQNER